MKKDNKWKDIFNFIFVLMSISFAVWVLSLGFKIIWAILKSL